MENKSNIVTSLGIAGLVLGIIALIVSFIPCFGIYAFYIGILSIIISVIGIVFAVKKKVGKGLLIAAIIISLVGSSIAYWQYTKIASIANDLQQEIQTPQ